MYVLLDLADSSEQIAQVKRIGSVHLRVIYVIEFKGMRKQFANRFYGSMDLLVNISKPRRLDLGKETLEIKIVCEVINICTKECCGVKRSM